MEKLKLLMLEDNKLDAELIKEELTDGNLNFIIKIVDTKNDFTNALKAFNPDIILSDYNLPLFTGFEALQITLEIKPDIPFILVTGNLSEEMAADSIKRGAWDYVLKSNLARLVPEINNALKLKIEKDKNKQATNKLIKLSSAVIQSANSIVITDLKGNIEYVNPKFAKSTGYTAAEVLGKNQRFLKSGYQPKKYYAKMWKTIVAGKSWSGEIQNKSKTGDLFWEIITITPIKDSAGKIINFLGVKEDITEQKKSELVLKESERNLLEAQKIAQLGTFNLDIKNNTFTSSPIFDEIIGISLKDAKIRELFDQLVHLDDIEENIKMVINCIKNKTQFDRVYRVITKDTQELKWIHGRAEIYYKKTNHHNLIGTIQDITKQKNTEIELQKSYDEINKLKNQLEEENVNLKEEIALAFNYEDLVYSSEEISDVLTQVEQVSNTDATVLLLGETGTGKELIAKAIHNTSNRKNSSLIRVNCATIPSELLESELFGHKKGSFTGANKDRVGKFQLANGGTLFLDEIGEMPLALQPKLLRAIQEGEIEPIGSSKIIKLDIRIIAATNRELEKDVDAKLFRQDLFFRLNVFPITIPPLRERIEDIPVLINYFLDKYCKKYKKSIKSISTVTLQQMKVYNWPGNVRELENLVERAVITSNQDRIIFSDFDNSMDDKLEKISNTNASLDEVQSNHIIKVLSRTQWKISGKDGAASLLNIKPSTLRDRMAKFGIKRP